MTMHSHISHHVGHAAPLLAGLALVVVVGAVGVALFDPIVMDDPQAGPMAVALGAGIDEMSLRTAGILDSFLPTDLKGWITAIAVFVTVWSVVKVIRELRGPVGGARDGGALVSHGLHRATIAMGVRAPSVPWGVVRDASSGHPLSLATVRLVGTDGVVLDRCVTDSSGRYGFRLSHASAVARGYHMDLQSSKSGYYPRPMARGGVHKHPEGLDIVMDRAGDGPVRVHVGRPATGWELAGAVLFWVGVILVPLVFFDSPDLLHGVMFGAFLGAGIVRATWRRPENT